MKILINYRMHSIKYALLWSTKFNKVLIKFSRKISWLRYGKTFVF